ncbi:MAG: bacillithiol biosynthesis cysteine-adding enzyme BshC [Blastocatellia bacterium]|nr:bacillithiol biosynthesis cysteine-adding enzyme BshC [Blastocatellia bacterium]
MNESDCNNLETAAHKLTDAMRFTDIPRMTPLFKDFLYDYRAVSRFYFDAGRAISPLADHARRVGAQEFDREHVADALTRINRRAGSPDLAFEHIETLRRPGSVAIVTGQQAGLFTGPLYTIHKALTVIKIAACLREQGVEAVPVFWIASEDHDYNEVNHCQIVDRDGHLKVIRYEAGGYKEDTPVGHVKLCEGISETIDEFIAQLPPSEFMPDIERDLRESYTHCAGFAESFARLMARLFKDYGVVLLDPLDEGLKQAVAPLYSQAIEKSSAIARALVERSRELEEAGYHAQVHVSEDMVPLFIMDDGKRVAMVEREGRFWLKGSEKKEIFMRSFDRQEMAELAGRCPNCFSPNVTLRPAVQDYLLPTAAYIGGPAEVAYFAQLRAVYETLGRQEPCVLPRASFTIIEGRHQKIMKKYRLALSDFFDGLHPAVTKVVEQSLDRDTANTFAETEHLFTEQLKKLDQSLKRTDSTLSASLEGARAKIFYQLEHLRTRFVHASAHREDTTYRQVERAYTTLYPNKNLQERELNVYYFLSRYGPGLINDLYEAADIGFSNHKLAYIGGVASQVVNAR